MRNGEISHWIQAHQPQERPHLEGDLSADVCIIGAGFTGLWAAYHYRSLVPQARVVVVEKEHVGFGASGRNAGWLSAQVPGNRAVFARTAGSTEAAVHLQQRMLGAVDEVLDIIAENDLDAHARRSGNLVVARTPAALERLRQRRLGDIRWGYPEDEVLELTAEQLRSRITVADATGALYYPTVGRVDPGRLVSELARLCESRGVEILEQTEVLEIDPGRVITNRGTIQAPVLLRATEGYSPTLSDEPREIIPINSSIIITDPLPDSAWDQIGWDGYELLSDSAHVFCYLQKTDDGRILIGGRGTPYRYASGIRADGTTDSRTVATLTERLHSMFPATRSVSIAHAWSGVLGVTRDWCASVRFDPESGIGLAQGYAGHGVTSAYLAAKSLVEVSLGHEEGDASLPWVGHRARNWEPEPIRWTGVHSMYRLFAVADSQEERSNAEKTSVLAQIGARISGLAD